MELARWISKFKVNPNEARKYVFEFFQKEHNTTKYPANWNQLRKKIYKMANYKCQYCGKGGYGLNAHHLRHLSNKGSNDLTNLICVCDECHSIRHPKNRELSNKHHNNLKGMNFRCHIKEGNMEPIQQEIGQCKNCGHLANLNEARICNQCEKEAAEYAEYNN